MLCFNTNIQYPHCVKSVQIRLFSGPYFSVQKDSVFGHSSRSAWISERSWTLMCYAFPTLLDSYSQHPNNLLVLKVLHKIWDSHKNDGEHLFDIFAQLVSQRNPVDTRRRFNVDKTSCDIARRRIDVETTSYVYWEVSISWAKFHLINQLCKSCKSIDWFLYDGNFGL